MSVPGRRLLRTTRRIDRQSIAVATVIPTYNPGPHLVETLASLERQILLPSEVVVVDDGSDPRVSLPPTSFPVRLIRISHSGIPTARNIGIRATGSPLIHICDHDDTIEPLFYQRTIDRFDQDPELDVVHAQCGFIDAGGSELAGRLPGWPPPYEGSPDATLRTLLKGNPIASVAAVFARGLFDELGGFQPYDFVQDWAFWLQAALRRRTFGFVPTVLAWHRIHPGQQSAAARTSQALAESIKMLSTLPISARHRWQRARTVADLRLELIRVCREDPRTPWVPHAVRALCCRPRSTLQAMIEMKR